MSEYEYEYESEFSDPESDYSDFEFVEAEYGEEAELLAMSTAEWAAHEQVRQDAELEEKDYEENEEAELEALATEVNVPFWEYPVRSDSGPTEAEMSRALHHFQDTAKAFEALRKNGVPEPEVEQALQSLITNLRDKWLKYIVPVHKEREEKRVADLKKQWQEEEKAAKKHHGQLRREAERKRRADGKARFLAKIGPNSQKARKESERLAKEEKAREARLAAKKERRRKAKEERARDAEKAAERARLAPPVVKKVVTIEIDEDELAVMQAMRTATLRRVSETHFVQVPQPVQTQVAAAVPVVSCPQAPELDHPARNMMMSLYGIRGEANGLCSAFWFGVKCTRQNCHYAHNFMELRLCHFGHRCRFAQCQPNGQWVNTGKKCCHLPHPDETEENYLARTESLRKQSGKAQDRAVRRKKNHTGKNNGKKKHSRRPHKGSRPQPNSSAKNSDDGWQTVQRRRR